MTNMHVDLKWLARAISSWPGEHDNVWIDADGEVRFDVGIEDDFHPSMPIKGSGETFSKSEWRQARKDLGLDQPEVTDAEEEEWQRMDKEQSRQQYSAYYKDVRHIEYIDVYRTVDLFGCEKHGHPISHAAKKLLLTGARTGGKDVEQDVREAIDSLYRWLEMREEDKRAL